MWCLKGNTVPPAPSHLWVGERGRETRCITQGFPEDHLGLEKNVRTLWISGIFLMWSTKYTKTAAKHNLMQWWSSLLAFAERKYTLISPSCDSLVKVNEWEDDLSGCRSAPVQSVALAHHQDGLVLLTQRPLAVYPPQHQRSIRVFIPADG